MNKTLYCTIALFAMLAAPSVHAAEDKLYAGLAFGSSGTVVISGDAGRFENTNNPLSARLYGGYDITENFAIEAGYAHFGKFKFALPVTVDLSAIHVAAKGSMPLGAYFSVFGKLGVTRHSIDVSGLGGENATKTRPLMGIGADYRLTENLSAALEFTDYGTIKSDGGRLTMRKFEAGLKYHF